MSVEDLKRRLEYYEWRAGQVSSLDPALEEQLQFYSERIERIREEINIARQTGGVGPC